MIDATWFRRLQQSLEFAVGFELFLLVGPGSYAERGLGKLAEDLARFGSPRWHALDRGGLDDLLAGKEPGVLHLVHGFERLPKPASRGIVARMNLNRARLRELDAPVLIWVPDSFYEEFVRQAPDLLAWRSQVDVVSPIDFEDREHEPTDAVTTSTKPPRVFISYSHESESHDTMVLDFAQRLRADGVDAWLDRFEPTPPPQGWPRWMSEQVERADFVVVVCTPLYRRRFEQGRSYEALLSSALLYQGALDLERVVPVVFAGSDDDAIPITLRAATVHELPQDYPVLLRRLTRTSAVVPARLGSTTALPPVERQNDEPALAELRAGDKLGGRYELLARVASGGFSQVWQARDGADGPVAIRLLSGPRSQDRSVIERFETGARTMAALRHPAIVPILEPVRVDAGHHFFVMPWLDGGDLRRALARATVGRDEALRACARAFEGMIHAHDQGIVHRNISPSNILLDERGQGWLTDFDLACASESETIRATAGLGDFVYAAPEQLRAEDRVDARADIYSAGMCLLFVLLGKDPPPLVALTEPKLLEQLPCSATLRDALVGALAYHPEQRTTTAPQLIAAIRNFVANSANTGPDSWKIGEGTDEFGRWATVRIGEVDQRMRWIEPGTFLMGSPASENDRSDNEGPQHFVTLTRGFWLADTPCTRALWTTLMSENVSPVTAPTHPIERVSWDDVQRFLAELAQRLPGPRFVLPSEAQWEWACRAGSTTARYAEVDVSAWCWQNSGGSTHEVGQKQPNAWGLFDMLGNVWEWCADGPRAFTSEPVTDPMGKSRDRRVCRGGSWGDDARFARAACRISYEPNYRFGSVGFRLCLPG